MKLLIEFCDKLEQKYLKLVPLNFLTRKNFEIIFTESKLLSVISVIMTISNLTSHTLFSPFKEKHINLLPLNYNRMVIKPFTIIDRIFYILF